ncbi:membrane protein insertion efficiency factor YidD [Chitinivibrio alkaliphilus]|uniref:Membrane protein insertion efficiency factor n=1 Tax=Chitinivibrio alkaliphilus ACht1 TaxID=1313304 RepID=U7D7V9_9BACT|nr:membrane protein insertion efficiency factor YidD [Chitinivibrio alkaliphilus]ERP31177.1 hypothetical protein CALK_1976 [Chitinivibrio alkaliphilus ACht1]
MRQWGKDILAAVLYAVIQAGKTIFLLDRGVCRFTPSCSVYARDAVKTLPLHRAMLQIIQRLIRCRPGGGFGYDPVQTNEVENE